MLPLYLFKEHWKLANLKIQAVLGFLCTLDPLGYNLTQRFTVPFLVLQQAIRQQLKAGSEANQLVVELVSQTCEQIIRASDVLSN